MDASQTAKSAGHELLSQDRQADRLPFVDAIGTWVDGEPVVTAAVNLTVVGAPWTTGTAAIGTAFTVPVVSSFTMAGIQAVYAQTPTASGRVSGADANASTTAPVVT